MGADTLNVRDERQIHSTGVRRADAHADTMGVVVCHVRCLLGNGKVRDASLRHLVVILALVGTHDLTKQVLDHVANLIDLVNRMRREALVRLLQSPRILDNMLGVVTHALKVRDGLEGVREVLAVSLAQLLTKQLGDVVVTIWMADSKLRRAKPAMLTISFLTCCTAMGGVTR